VEPDNKTSGSKERISLQDIGAEPKGSASPDVFQADQAYELHAGEIIDEKYEIIELISAGGMGAVYKALHRKLAKFMAIKVLSADKLAEDVTYRRFEREAKAAAALNHPNVVHVYDCGLLRGDRPYIAMEYLDGISLDNFLSKNGYLEFSLAVAVLSQMCDALSHAHAHGLIHRDLKPSNIMLLKDDRGSLRAKIIDFGIAKFAKIETRPITRPGQIFGSPLYMSPEQCIGKKLDPRSDIYALGCVLYESLCGRPPFVGETLLNTIYLHVNEEPLSFMEHVDAQSIPARLERIVLKMLQKRPEDRFQSADEILAALSDVQPATQEMQEASDQKANAASKFLSNNVLRAVVSILIALVLAVLFKIWVDRPALESPKNSPSYSPASKHHPLERGKIGHLRD